MSPWRIYVHLWARPWGGAVEIERAHVARGFPGIGFHAIVGSPCPTEAAHLAGRPSRLYDGRVEVGRAADAPEVENPPARYGFDGKSLAFAIIGISWHDISRRQIQVAAQLCYQWKWDYHIRLDNVLPSEEIERGEHVFDMDVFRTLVQHWERGSRIMRAFQTSA